MYFAVNKGDKLAFYRAASPPKVNIEKVEVPGKELGPSRRWRNVTARLVRVTVKGGTEIGTAPYYYGHVYCNPSPKVGEVQPVLSEYKKNMLLMYRAHKRRRGNG